MLNYLDPTAHWVDVGTLSLHLLEWPGYERPIVLLHGDGSDCRVWEPLGYHLAAEGHRVLAVDLRGHGLSDKPDGEYDFATVSTDVATLIATLELQRPIVVGQSWGGNIVLDFGARYPGLASGLGIMDGECMAQSRHHDGWERRIMASTFDEGSDDWLARSRQMAIQRALWEQSPKMLYPKVQDPVLLMMTTRHGQTGGWQRQPLIVANQRLRNSQIYWLPDTEYEVHLHYPELVAELFLRTIREGIWAGGKKGSRVMW